MALLDPKTIETYTPSPRFETTEKGVFYIALDNEGNEKPPMQLSSCIDIIGSGIHTNGEAYRVIEYTHSVTREKRIAAIPNSAIGSNWSYLQGLGITIFSGRLKRERLADYLQTQGSREQWLITDKAGWINGAYVLPNGDIITPAEPLEPTGPNQTMRVFYNGDKSQAQAYQVSGSLKDWQDNVARYAQHNSRLCLAIGTAFAAPLLSLLNLEGGGFHIYGESASGKSTALFTGLSVWASPKAKTPWNATPHALSNAAAARNDNTLMLDEIGENHDTRAIAKTVLYTLANGQGKIQGHKDGGNRETIEFKVLFFSTGEHPLESYVTQKDRAQWNAGQNVRLPSIPSNTGKNIGAFDTLHNFTSARELADHLNQAAYHHHGAAGRAFIQQLHSGSLKTIRDLIAQFMAQLPPLGSQATRVARRFAIAAALEYAQAITGFQAGQGMNAIKECFTAWLQHNGSGDYEQERIIAQTRDFMDKYAYGLRFTHRNAQREDHAPNHAGYCEEKNGIRILHVIPAIIESEAWQGFDKTKACEVLIAIDWLQGSKDRHTMQLVTTQGKKWLYRFHGATPPESTPNQAETETVPH